VFVSCPNGCGERCLRKDVRCDINEAESISIRPSQLLEAS